MTGRDLILYILENNLENENVFEDGKFIGFLTVGEAAEKFDVGTETIKLWVKHGYLDSVTIGDAIYIPSNATPPIIVGGSDEKKNTSSNISRDTYGSHDPSKFKSNISYRSYRQR